MAQQITIAHYPHTIHGLPHRQAVFFYISPTKEGEHPSTRVHIKKITRPRKTHTIHRPMHRNFASP